MYLTLCSIRVEISNMNSNSMHYNRRRAGNLAVLKISRPTLLDRALYLLVKNRHP